MAGLTTKGNTDDVCEPLPIPSLMVGYEREWMSVSPLSLYYWDSLNFEPWAAPRDVAYLVLAPDNENILEEVRVFLRALTNGYEVRSSDMENLMIVIHTYEGFPREYFQWVEDFIFRAVFTSPT